MVLSSRREGLIGYNRKALHRESGEVLAQAARRGCGCPIPEGVQDQVGWSPGHPGLGPDLEMAGWKMILWVLSNPRHSTIL